MIIKGFPMKTHRLIPASLIAIAVLAGCNSVPEPNEALDQARSDFNAAQANPVTSAMAAGELKQAGEALAVAETSLTKHDSTREVDHLAYLARQRVAIANETGKRHLAEKSISDAAMARDAMRLAARTNEADAANLNAAISNSNAAASDRSAANAKATATIASAVAVDSMQQADQARARNTQLEGELSALNARKTDRGMVITMGDMLFDTDKSQLKDGAMRNVDRLAAFLKEYPQRKAAIEGFTDSTGSQGRNQELSEQRAGAVRTVLIDQGIAPERVSMRGFGPAYPVAGNDSAGGRQMNRRVEVLLSDQYGVITPR